MPPASARELQHRRAHNLLLASKLLGGRENVSPFTLVVDGLEMSGRGVVGEFVRRAKAAKTKVVFVAFETLRKPKGVDEFVRAAGMSVAALQKELGKHVTAAVGGGAGQKTLLILDTLNPLATTHPTTLPHLLSSLLSPRTSLLATYHNDIPLPPSATQNHPYTPHPLTLLKFLTTTILTVHSLAHILAQKAAADRSHAAPVFGLAEEIEGVVRGVGANDARGTVIEMEYRRKSGRGVREWFFLPNTPASISTPAAGSVVAGMQGRPKDRIILLEDHALYRRELDASAPGAKGEEDIDTTFSLGLTEKQRRDREGVVLPYFDAQRLAGEAGEGGRILYDLGVEDDFDEEEDEI